MTRVLFVSVRNAGVSQLALALHEHRGGTARSAGLRPADELDEAVVEALEETGIDVSGRVPRTLVPADLEWAELVVTMGGADTADLRSGARRLDWDLPDPVGLCLEEVRELRTVVEQRVAALPL